MDRKDRNKIARLIERCNGKCVESYGAELITLQLVSTDPNGLNRSSDEAAQTAKKVAGAVDVPVIVWGSGNADKDADVLRKVTEVCDATQEGLRVFCSTSVHSLSLAVF